MHPIYSKMHIHKAGYGIIAVSLLVSILLGILFFYLVPDRLLLTVLCVLVSLVFIGVVSFFRIPKRKEAFGEGAVIAPADGTIVQIKETFEKEFFKENRLQVSIFMSPLNVHANYCPLEGEVKLTAYHPGKYFVAWLPKSSDLNEHHTVVIRHKKHGDILVRQIAGAMARRIVNYLTVSQEVKQNEDLGFIKFGSRVDLFLPLDADIHVKLKQKVRGRQTVIARLK